LSIGAIPITLITGFLGAGKTTLLNTILRAEHGLRVAVLVNDFGEVNIDSLLIVGVEGETVSLANGCICCTIRDDLLQATLQVINRPDRPEYIIVETSGISDPEAVALTFLTPELRPHVALDSILTLVDADQVLALSGQDAILAIDQVAVADIVVLNKADLAGPDGIARAGAWVREITPRARILEAVHGQVPLELVLGVGQFSPENLSGRGAREVHVHAAQAEPAQAQGDNQTHEHESEPVQSDHTLIYETWRFGTAEPLVFKAVREAVKTLPTTIFRAKGVLHFSDSPTRRGLLHVVGKRVRLTLGEPWGAETPRSEFVVIGTAGGIDPDDLQRRFEACLERNAEPEKPMSLDAALDWVRTAFGVTPKQGK
jgi:G3E family GTPase